ncbi:hexosaminidase D-like isoform X1 [Sitophilus oryzae]|uniref:beta-N-acetylhexosaminidase n=1 Tax=Sitophilus oryzae TaxID=7048 RepID=A0A6J2XG72_SITOR|nr:hexosaminidase D-like isoform X1 [Sitophilus oryzae]
MESEKNNMNNFVYRVGFTAWRKKTTILVGAGLLTLILFGLQFSVIDHRPINLQPDEKDEAFLQSIKVKFIEAANLNSKDRGNNIIPHAQAFKDNDMDRLRHLDQPSRDEIAKRQMEKSIEETDEQLGIPYVNDNSKKPYVPNHRIVHFDLKGAPPTIMYFKKIMSLAKNVGATGLLIEYEDMFPYTGILKPLSAKNAYTVEEVKEILKYAQDLKLEVIPLIQTFGHMEFALKHKEFANIREVPGSPQALCPSRNASFDLIRELISQVVDMHPTSKYLHIGCDEVFEMGECEVCRMELHETLFLRHVQNVANIVNEKKPNLKIIIWDDMLRHISSQNLQAANLGDLVQPMVWVYAEDIYRFVQPPIWDKYAAVFKTAWTASAFKGAFGETLYIPNAKRHLENNMRWLEVMSTQSTIFKHNLGGIVLTGWQRYDHFAVLCELLPAAIPSLVLNLLATSNGFFNATLKDQFLSNLNCPQPGDRRSSPFLNLEGDPKMWEKLSRCMFPGNGFFKLMYRLHNIENEAKEYIDMATKHKGWLTDYNAKYNYSLPLRVEELTQDLPRVYHGMVSLARNAADSLNGLVDNYTISEWIEQRIYPYMVELEKIQNKSTNLKGVNYWPARPLPMLKELQKHGIAIG